MDSQNEALPHLIIAVVIMLVFSGIAYFAGCKIAAMYYLSGDVKIDATQWEGYFVYIVVYMGIVAALILLLWTVLTHWAFQYSSTGKRGLWAILGLILVGLCVATPEIVKMIFGLEEILITDEKIPILFVICYCLFGYWGGSIFVTSERFKNTPLLAGFVR